jgi:hypothetical protein
VIGIRSTFKRGQKRVWGSSSGAQLLSLQADAEHALRPLTGFSPNAKGKVYGAGYGEFINPRHVWNGSNPVVGTDADLRQVYHRFQP